MFSPSGNRLWGVRENRLPAPPYHSTGVDDVVSLSWPDRKVSSCWPHRGELTRVAAGDRWVLAGTHNGRTKLLRAGDGQLEKDWPSPDGSPVRSVALSRDEALAASGTQAGRLQVVRVPDGTVVAEIDAHRDSLDTVAFAPDGRHLATGSRDRAVHLWRLAEGGYEKLITLPADGPVTAVAFSPDGNALAVLVHDEYAVRLWRLDRLRARLQEAGLAW